MVEINNTTGQRIEEKKIISLVEAFLRVYKKRGWDVSIALVGDRRMRSINNEYRQQDKATDVLSFGGDRRNKYLGEVIISLDQVARLRNYQDILSGLVLNKKSVLYFLIVHGLLHLVGYEDEGEKDRQKMINLGRKFLAQNA